jgi:hypothetical protein
LERDVVPKLIVLFCGDEHAATSLAEQAATGAKGFRFMEVDVRSAGGGSGGKRLESAAQLRDYDGVLLAYAASDELPAELRAIVDELASGEPLPNTVFGVTGDSGSALEAVGRLGGIIVLQPRGADAAERAGKLGARLAKVVGWVRHGIGHEHQ